MKKTQQSLSLLPFFFSLVLVIIVIIAPTTTIYAQIPGQAQQIVNTAKTECATKIRTDVPAELKSVYVDSCISLVHESPTMIVLTGDLLINTSPLLYADNTPLWKAVNNFKDSGGYTFTTVEITGQGRQANPHKLYVVMSK